MSDDKKKKKPMRMSKRVVWYAFSAITIFMLLQFILLISGHEGFSDFFSMGWFTCWGYELGRLAGIKNKELENPFLFPNAATVLNNNKDDDDEEASE